MDKLQRVMNEVTHDIMSTGNAVITCEIKLFKNYINLRRRPTQIILL